MANHVLSITYEGSEIAYLDNSGVQILATEGKYCEDNVTITYVEKTLPAAEEHSF